MKIPTRLSIPVLSSLLLAMTACGGKEKPAEAAETPKPGETTKQEPAGDEAGDGPAEAPTPAEVAEGAKGTSDADGTEDDAPAPEAGGTEGDEPAAETEAGDADPIKPLLDEVTNKRTKDDRAMAALEEAKAAGAEPKQLAEAANKRGERLGSDVERATKFYEWAAAADPKHAKATFNLAKIAANSGDIDTAKELLLEVKERGGKRLLKNVGFDPTFALLHDDPDIISLSK